MEFALDPVGFDVNVKESPQSSYLWVQDEDKNFQVPLRFNRRNCESLKELRRCVRELDAHFDGAREVKDVVLHEDTILGKPGAVLEIDGHEFVLDRRTLQQLQDACNQAQLILYRDDPEGLFDAAFRPGIVHDHHRPEPKPCRVGGA